MVSADGVTYDIPEVARSHSEYLRRVGTSRVQLGTPYFIVEKLAMYLNYIHNHPVTDTEFTPAAKPWEFEFTSLSQDFLFELLEAADSMGMQGLRTLV